MPLATATNVLPSETPEPTGTATPITSPTPQPDGRIVYTVAPGDGFLLIAGRFGVELSDLYAYNNLTADSLLTVGQTLVIGYSVFPDGSTALPGFPQARVKTDGTIIHLVKEGDTLLGIATTYDLTLEELAGLSELADDAILQVGQEVKVGARPQPQEVGGSSDLPAELITATASPTASRAPTNTPSPTSLPASPTVTATATIETAVPPTQLTVAGGTPPSSLQLNALLPLFLGMVGLLAFTGALFLYLGRNR
jgi:LysM repeat protein